MGTTTKRDQVFFLFFPWRNPKIALFVPSFQKPPSRLTNWSCWLWNQIWGHWTVKHPKKLLAGFVYQGKREERDKEEEEEEFPYAATQQRGKGNSQKCVSLLNATRPLWREKDSTMWNTIPQGNKGSLVNLANPESVRTPKTSSSFSFLHAAFSHIVTLQPQQQRRIKSPHYHRRRPLTHNSHFDIHTGGVFYTKAARPWSDPPPLHYLVGGGIYQAERKITKLVPGICGKSLSVVWTFKIIILC